MALKSLPVKKKYARRGLRIDDNGFDFVIFFVEFLAHNGITCRKYKIFNASESQYGKYNRVYGKQSDNECFFYCGIIVQPRKKSRERKAENGETASPQTDNDDV